MISVLDSNIAVLKARINENDSLLEMAKLHMDERACMVINDRINALHAELSPKLFEKIKSMTGPIADIIQKCWKNGAVDMDMVIRITCGGKSTTVFDECRKFIDELSLTFTITMEGDPETIKRRVEELYKKQ